MTADVHQYVSLRECRPHVQRATERKRLAVNMCDPAAVLIREIERAIGRAGVNDNDL